MLARNGLKLLPGFLKPGPGEYGEGDEFLGVTVPQLRQIAKDYKTLEMADITKLLHSKLHEERFLAVIILVGQYKQADEFHQEEIYNFYLSQTAHINNWDSWMPVLSILSATF